MLVYIAKRCALEPPCLADNRAAVCPPSALVGYDPI